jgi:hypothetical protein
LVFYAPKRAKIREECTQDSPEKEMNFMAQEDELSTVFVFKFIPLKSSNI